MYGDGIRRAVWDRIRDELNLTAHMLPNGRISAGLLNKEDAFNWLALIRSSLWSGEMRWMLSVAVGVRNHCAGITDA